MTSLDTTPVECHGGYLVKRDDLYERAGVRGGKVRTCYRLVRQALAAGGYGLVTAGAARSLQGKIVARLGAEAGLAVRVHTASGQLGPEMLDAAAHGAVLVQHRPGYSSVLAARARADAAALSYFHVPWVLECREAVEETAAQVRNLPWGEFKRIVVPVGSGMSLAGVLHGVWEYAPAPRPTVLGVVCGADPTERLAKWRPLLAGYELAYAGVPYSTPVTAMLGSLALDPIYEAKCARVLAPGDLLWVVGAR